MRGATDWKEHLVHVDQLNEEGLLSAEPPLVSIIVPSYNQGQFIRRTLESILSQDYRPIEIIVVDGASSDETLAILSEFSVAPELQWTSEPDSGVVEAVNKGFARARGQIGAIQSSDDFYLPGAISAGVHELCADQRLAFAFGDVAKVDPEGNELSRTCLPAYSLEALLSLAIWIPQPSTFFRLPLAKTLGGWRESVPYAADTDLWLRMAVLAEGRKVNRLMAQRTMHGEQRDRLGGRIARDYAKAIDLLLESKALSLRLRRAAFAGKQLLFNRYGYEDSRGAKQLRLWRAALAYPALFTRVPMASFVPGWYWLRALIVRAVRFRRGVRA